MLKAWKIKFDTRFIENQYSFVQPGTVSFRDNQEKSLAEIVNPMSYHNYVYQYQNFFSNVALDDIIEGEFAYMIP